jgi:leucyl-tRNA synthetase
MIPHVAEAMWAELGHSTMLCHESWPKADPALLVDESVTLAVQVNGKLRGTITIARDAAEQAAKDAALAVANVQTAMAGKQARKIVVVPNKIVNIVV